MNTAGIVAKLEEQLVAQRQVAGDDPIVEQLVDAMVAALAPALRQAALELAEQAATEIGAQLPAGRIDIVISDGEPTLVLRGDESDQAFSTEDLEARMTVRLPVNLKTNGLVLVNNAMRF